MTPREVFVDASAWIAIVRARDAHHAAAVETFRHLLQERTGLVTTNLVVAEAYVLIRRADGHAPAMRFLQSLGQTGRLERVRSDAALEEAAEAILARYTDHDFSFADAVSFALMRHRGMAAAFGFDRHFLAAGFSLLPALA